MAVTYQTEDGEWTIGDGAKIEVKDERDDLPIFVHSELDDAPLSSDAFRVYAHLARRRNKSSKEAWPSYLSMGTKCFGADYDPDKEPAKYHDNSLRRRVMRSVKELLHYKLITKEVTTGETNTYKLTPKSAWDFRKLYAAQVKEDEEQKKKAKGQNGVMSQDVLVSQDHPLMSQEHHPYVPGTPKGTTSKGYPVEGTTISALSLFTQPDVSEQAPPTTSASSRKKEPKQERQVEGALCQHDVPGSSQAEVFGALSEVCRLDTKIKRVATQVGKAASELRAAGYTAPDVVRFGQWWYANDFRGRQGQVPGLNLIPTLIPQSRSVAPPPEAPQEHRYEVDALRSWHRTWSYAEWNSHVAVEQGKFPADKIAYGEWYAATYGNLSEDELSQWWREQEEARKESE